MIDVRRLRERGGLSRKLGIGVCVGVTMRGPLGQSALGGWNPMPAGAKTARDRTWPGAASGRPARREAIAGKQRQRW